MNSRAVVLYSMKGLEPSREEWIMAEEITEFEDVLDSRTIIERIQELEEREAELSEATEDDDDQFTDEESQELADLRELAQQGETVADWVHGVTLVRDSYWVDYAKEYAEDTVLGLTDVNWPHTHIDWDAAAADLQTDYTSLEFRDVTYWAR